MSETDGKIDTKFRPQQLIQFEVYQASPSMFRDLANALPPRWTMKLSTTPGDGGALVSLEGPYDPKMEEIVMNSELVKNGHTAHSLP